MMKCVGIEYQDWYVLETIAKYLEQVASVWMSNLAL